MPYDRKNTITEPQRLRHRLAQKGLSEDLADPQYALAKVEGSEKLCLAFNEQSKQGGGIIVGVTEFLKQKEIAMRIARACVVCRRDVLVVNMAKASMEVTNADWRNDLMRRMDEMVIRRTMGTPTLIIEGFFSCADKNPYNQEVVSWMLHCIAEILYSQNSVVIVSKINSLCEGTRSDARVRQEMIDNYPSIDRSLVNAFKIFPL